MELPLEEDGFGDDKFLALTAFSLFCLDIKNANK